MAGEGARAAPPLLVRARRRGRARRPWDSLSSLSQGPAPSAARAAIVQGQVECVAPTAEWTPLPAGVAIPEGARVRTVGEGRAAFELARRRVLARDALRPSGRSRDRGASSLPRARSTWIPARPRPGAESRSRRPSASCATSARSSRCAPCRRVCESGCARGSRSSCRSGVPATCPQWPGSSCRSTPAAGCSGCRSRPTTRSGRGHSRSQRRRRWRVAPRSRCSRGLRARAANASYSPMRMPSCGPRRDPAR